MTYNKTYFDPVLFEISNKKSRSTFDRMIQISPE
jgi:hypothetical protein